MNSKIKQMLNSFTIDKYYRMSDKDLQDEAAEWHIGGYADGQYGIINRQIIIDALIKKHQANNSRVAILISIIALAISILGIIF